MHETTMHETTMHETTGVMPRSMRLLGAALAALVAVMYLAIGLGMMPDGFESPPRPVMLAAGAAYLVGGGLILIAGRRLLLLGAVVNGVVLALFLLSAARGNATVDAFSLSGKAVQVALGVLLVWAVRRRHDVDRELVEPVRA